jgi:hypothetical protein
MADEHRFDWGAILRASGIIIGIATVYAFVVPIAGAFADGDGPISTGTVAANQIYRWLFWALAWGVTIWQGAWMIRQVHDRIIDDMLVTAVIVGVVLLIVKIVVWAIYIVGSEQDIFPITGIDAAGALTLVVVALIGARANRY